MRLSGLLAIVCCCVLPAAAHTEQLVEHHVHTIASKVLNESRTVLVHKPLDYDQGNRRYPVLYMLDGHAPHLLTMPGHLMTLTNAEKMPPMLLVSIQNTDRWRDLTPTSGNRPGRGGADPFLRFIETEVFPLVEKNYRTEPFRIFAGHSLGGLLVTFSLIEYPHLFNAYLAASPVLHWDNDYIVSKIKQQQQKNRVWRGNYFAVLGNEPSYQQTYDRVKTLFGDIKQTGFEVEMRSSLDDDHMTTPIATYFYGLKKIWSAWALDGSTIDDLPALTQHFQRASQRYGYTMVVPEARLNQLGYQLLQQQKRDDAITTFKFAITHYPASPNAHDSLAEAYERQGQLADALTHYQRAAELAKNNPDQNLRTAIERNLQRVQTALTSAGIP